MDEAEDRAEKRKDKRNRPRSPVLDLRAQEVAAHPSEPPPPPAAEPVAEAAAAAPLGAETEPASSALEGEPTPFATTTAESPAPDRSEIATAARSGL